MLSSITYGFGSMCDGLVDKLKRKMGLKFRVIATGGSARLISQYSTSIEKIDEDLTLKGINLIYQALMKNIARDP